MTNLLEIRAIIEALANESSVDEGVLQRGLELFNKGAVEDLQELDQGFYTAEVQGNTSSYKVSVYTTKSKTKPSVICTCPYQQDVYCKHGVAVLLAIDKKMRQSIEDRIQNLTIEELRKIVLEKFLSDRSVPDIAKPQRTKDVFVSLKFAYKKEINNIVRSHKDRHGFIDYRSSFSLEREMNLLLMKGRTLIPFQPEETLITAGSILNILPELIQNMDDSNGSILSFLSEAVSLFRDVAGKWPERKEAVVQESISFYKSYTSSSSDFWEYFIDLALELGSSSNQANEILLTLQNEIAKYDSDSYRVSYSVIRIFKIYDILNKQNEGFEFLKGYMKIPEVRKIFINKKINEGAFSEAEKLIQEGIALAPKHHWE
ncbi:SWIM zinc finger family protein [Leptospira ilyithenensis]|uniref:SWIM-type domain-containing protein n=1 Tax=Leptospira ilyithenensis TaxID=2484901 RepID=A0A4R9LV35_9LEPT|nr:hypothetical protein [Leptospira ilyithenensis]TGN13167.1 hypothetical protein EHS11_04535 [Leptospira ilyithenensis]